MRARLWSQLPPWERRAKLAEVHRDLTEDFLIADGLAVAELAPQIKAQKSKEDKVMVVLRYFGDEGHPQPEERGALAPLIFGLGESAEAIAARARRSPPWGQLPQLEPDEPGPPTGDKNDLLGGEPYSRVEYMEAGKLHAKNKMTIQGIENHTSLKQKRAYRIYRQFREGAVVYDDAGLRPGPGYRWDPFELDNDPPHYKLIRR